MKNVSNALLGLYEAAENASIDAFPGETVRLLHTVFNFDRAVIGIGDAPLADHLDLVIEYDFVNERGSAILAGHERTLDQDLIAQHFQHGLSEPLRGGCEALFRSEGFPAMKEFARKHGLRHAMLFGARAECARPLWIVLYRCTDEGFTRHEGNDLLMLWPHLEHCVRINRVRHLERQLRRHEARAAALLNQNGFIEAADPRFRELLAIEWPLSGGERIPQSVFERVRTGQDFEGLRIRIALFAQDDLIVCKAYEKDLLSTLTPAEMVVALQFSRGLTHKDVALNLGVSQNTVRSHIKHVYDKLAINNKARLAQLMAESHLR